MKIHNRDQATAGSRLILECSFSHKKNKNLAEKHNFSSTIVVVIEKFRIFELLNLGEELPLPPT
mgnify:CR=1 FL=1